MDFECLRLLREPDTTDGHTHRYLGDDLLINFKQVDEPAPPRRHALPLARENRSVLRNTGLDAAPMLKTFAHLNGCTWLGQGSGDPALGPCTLIARYGFTSIRNQGYGLGTPLLMFDNSNAGRCGQAVHHRHAQVHQGQVECMSSEEADRFQAIAR